MRRCQQDRYPPEKSAQSAPGREDGCKPLSRRRAVLRALRKESEADLRAQIRRLLALPMEERTHFLRVRLPGGGTAL
jgi:hypothetical protein